MPRRQIRTKSGRLTRKAWREIWSRSRRPSGKGVVAILERGRVNKGGVRGRFSDRIELQVMPGSELYFDGDARTLVHGLQVALASHFRESLIDQVSPTDRSPLPKVTEVLDTGEVITRKYAVDSGAFRDKWGIGKITKSSGVFKARGAVFPNKEGGRAAMIAASLKRSPQKGGPIDFQGVTGDAARVIEDVTSLWVEASFGSKLYTPVYRSRGDTDLTKV